MSSKAPGARNSPGPMAHICDRIRCSFPGCYGSINLCFKAQDAMGPSDRLKWAEEINKNKNTPAR